MLVPTFAPLAVPVGVACSSAPRRCLALTPGSRIDSLPLLRAVRLVRVRRDSRQRGGHALLCCASANDPGCRVGWTCSD